MSPDDVPVWGPELELPFDEEPFFQGEDLAPDDPGGRRPADDGDCDDRRLKARSHHRAQDDDERKPRYHEEEVRRAGERRIRESSVVAGRQTDRGPEDHG